MDAGSGCRKNGDKDGPSSLSDLVTMSARHFLGNSMRPQHSEHPTGRCRTPAALDWRLSLGLVQKFLNIAVAEAVDQKLAVIDRGQQFLISAPGP